MRFSTGIPCKSDSFSQRVRSPTKIAERKSHRQLPQNGKKLTEKEITHFGTRPLRYWQSMHTRAEVAALAEQFETSEEAILNSRHEETEVDYNELIPVLDKLEKNSRVLYVGVDT